MNEEFETPIEEIIEGGETQRCEFKNGEAFEGKFRDSVCAAICAFSNTRGGGLFIIAIDDTTREPTEFPPEAQTTYDRTVMYNYLKNRLSPVPQFALQFQTFKDKEILVIKIPEFSKIPTVLSNSLDTGKKRFKAGDILIRTESAETKRISGEAEMRAFLQLCIKAHKDDIITSISDLLNMKTEYYSPELDERDFEKARDLNLPTWRQTVQSLKTYPFAHFEALVVPIEPQVGKFENQSFDKILSKLVLHDRTIVNHSFPYYSPGRLKVMDGFVCFEAGKPLMQYWEFTRGAIFSVFQVVWSQIRENTQFTDTMIPISSIYNFTYELLAFSRQIAESTEASSIGVQMTMNNIRDKHLVTENGESFSYISHENRIVRTIEIKSNALESSLTTLYKELGLKFVRVFNDCSWVVDTGFDLR